jgi:hypothetical protein
MLNIIYQDFKNYLEYTFPDIKIDEYRGEFEEKFAGGWNPSFPCCLIKLEEYAPLVRAASQQIIRHKAEFTLYIAEKNSLGFELIQQLIEDLNDTLLQLAPPPSPPGPQPASPHEPEPSDPENDPEADPETDPLETYYVEVNSVKFFKAINSVRVHTLSLSIS